MSLIANAIEAAGMPTVVMGAAKDIVEHVGVPRFAFSDVPLGHSAGPPRDTEGQRAVLETAFQLFEKAFAPRTTVQTPVRWNDGDHGWKHDFNNPEQLSPDRLERIRSDFERQKELADLNR